MRRDALRTRVWRYTLRVAWAAFGSLWVVSCASELDSPEAREGAPSWNRPR